MKAIMTGVAVAALVAAAPALAVSERLQIAQAEQTQEELQNTTACPEGETMTAEGEPCPPDTAAAPADEAEGEETEAAETAPQEGTTEELTAEEDATEEATEEVAAEDAIEEDTETAAAEGERFIVEQGEDEVLASELIGLTVYNPEDEALGDVSDIVWTEEGGVEAIIVGVGGFLGIGQKRIAVNFSAVEMTTDENGNKEIRLAATHEELDAAPEYLTQAEKLAAIEAERQQQLAPPADGGGMAPAPLQ